MLINSNETIQLRWKYSRPRTGFVIQSIPFCGCRTRGRYLSILWFSIRFYNHPLITLHVLITVILSGFYPLYYNKWEFFTLTWIGAKSSPYCRNISKLQCLILDLNFHRIWGYLALAHCRDRSSLKVMIWSSVLGRWGKRSRLWAQSISDLWQEACFLLNGDQISNQTLSPLHTLSRAFVCKSMDT